MTDHFGRFALPGLILASFLMPTQARAAHRSALIENAFATIKPDPAKSPKFTATMNWARTALNSADPL